MSPQERQHFDRLLEQLLAELPQQVTRLMDEVPVIVEDHPSRTLMRELGIEHRDELCGLFRGVSVTEPELEHGRPHSDQVLLFREGIFAEAADERGRITDDELRRQIRITILHEYGHHFGLDEELLRELGYG